MPPLNEICEMTLEQLKKEYPLNVYELWFKDLKLKEIDDTHAVFSINSDFKQSLMQKVYIGPLSEALKTVIPTDLAVSIISTEGDEGFSMPSFSGDPNMLSEDEKRAAEIANHKREVAEAIERPSIVEEYTFDNFIVGESNNFAHAACIAVANSPVTKFNPLFIYGPSGLGKTHLLYAVTNELKRRNPGTKIIYKNGEDFTNELIASITSGSTTKFRDRYRNADVLLIDDIQFIAGRESTQEEFFHTFNALHAAHKQIILTSDRPPKDIKTLEERLRTRFEWGLIADIQPPSLELRTAIILKKAEFYELDLAPEIIEYLSLKLQDNIRQIEGAIKKIAAISLLTNTPVTLDMCKRSIADFLSEEVPLSVTLDRIFGVVSKKYNVSVDEIKGKRRNDNIANARHICIYLIRNMTEMSLSAIGELFSRDHTTIISSIKKVERDIGTYKNMDEEIRALMNEIES